MKPLSTNYNIILIVLFDLFFIVFVQENNKRKHSYVLLRQQNDHDLVLEFETVSSQKKFLKKLEDFLSLHKKDMKINELTSEIMLPNAETKERRQKRLEYFFREAYALTFGLRYDEVDSFLVFQLISFCFFFHLKL